MPQCVALAAMENEYTQFPALSTMAEDHCGIALVERVLKNHKEAWTPLNHPTMTLNIRADHISIERLRNDQKDMVFSVQSLSNIHPAIIRVATGSSLPEDVFYVRPPCKTYQDGNSEPYAWSAEQYEHQLAEARCSALDYLNKIEDGVSTEHAGGVLISSYLQNAVITGSLRAWIDMLDKRSGPYESFEIKLLIDMIGTHVQRWAPETFHWWDSHRKFYCLEVA